MCFSISFPARWIRQSYPRFGLFHPFHLCWASRSIRRTRNIDPQQVVNRSNDFELHPDQPLELEPSGDSSVSTRLTCRVRNPGFATRNAQLATSTRAQAASASSAYHLNFLAFQLLQSGSARTSCPGRPLSFASIYGLTHVNGVYDTTQHDKKAHQGRITEYSTLMLNQCCSIPRHDCGFLAHPSIKPGFPVSDSSAGKCYLRMGSPYSE